MKCNLCNESRPRILSNSFNKLKLIKANHSNSNSNSSSPRFKNQAYSLDERDTACNINNDTAPNGVINYVLPYSITRGNQYADDNSYSPDQNQNNILLSNNYNLQFPNQNSMLNPNNFGMYNFLNTCNNNSNNPNSNFIPNINHSIGDVNSFFQNNIHNKFMDQNSIYPNTPYQQNIPQNAFIGEYDNSILNQNLSENMNNNNGYYRNINYNNGYQDEKINSGKNIKLKNREIAQYHNRKKFREEENEFNEEKQNKILYKRPFKKLYGTGARNLEYVKVGDWICRSCQNINFAFRKKCNKCNSKFEEFGESVNGNFFNDSNQ